MTIYIFHYHLLPGGVTGVIRNACVDLLTPPGGEASSAGASSQEDASPLSSDLKIVLVSGQEENARETLAAVQRRLSPRAAEKISLTVIPEIGYLSEQRGQEPGADEIEAILRARCGASNTAPAQEEGVLWWIHNYQLGKNPPFTQALLNILARDKGTSPPSSPLMLFQIHDFPECARFENLALIREGTEGALYPLHHRLRYAVINGRDRHLLIQAGLPREAVFLLENPVPPASLPAVEGKDLHRRLTKGFGHDFPGFSRLPEGQPYLFYPIRTIRRKNVLEMMMLSYLSEGEAPLVVTLPGVSTQEKEYSALVADTWQTLELPGLWGIGAGLEEKGIAFPELIAGSGRVVSSAVQEGFGYLFINALQWHKPLTARYLDILKGMEDVFPKNAAVHFYQGVPVPVDRALGKKTRAAYQERLRSLEGKIPAAAHAALARRIDEALPEERDQLDFSYLSVADQRAFLLRLKNDDTLRRETARGLQELLENLSAFPSGESVYPPTQRAALEERIHRRFGRESYRQQVRTILASYGSSSPKAAPKDGSTTEENRVQDNLIQLFAHPDYLRLLYQ